MNHPPKNTHIEQLSADQHRQWDKFVEQSAQGTLFHTSVWAGLVEKVFGRRCRIIVLKKSDEIEAGMMFWPLKRSFINTITRIAATTYQGPLFKDTESSKNSTIRSQYNKRCNALIAYIQKHYHLIDIPLSPAISDVRPFQWQGFNTSVAYTYRFQIREYEQLEQQFSQDLRRKLKQIESKNVRFEKSEDCDTLAGFVVESYRQHGMKPPVPEESIRTLIREALALKIGLLYYQYGGDRVVAGIFVLHDASCVYAVFSGIAPGERENVNGELIHAHVMRDPQHRGKIFDFLGANTQDLEQFKRSFGGELVPYPQVTWWRNNRVKMLFRLKSGYNLLKRKS